MMPTNSRAGCVGNCRLSFSNNIHEGHIVWKPILAIAVGSTLGGLLRWRLGLRLNSMFPGIPLGTLASNLIAGYLVGLAVAFFAQTPNLSPEWRLLAITGFCGGLSTFSTFSAEIVASLQRGQYSLAAGAIAVHVTGSVLMTIAGIATMAWLKAS